jgi:hypothetical protein
VKVITQVVVKHGPLNYLCEPMDFGWLCGKCRGMVRPQVRHKCGQCGAMVTEVRDATTHLNHPADVFDVECLACIATSGVVAPPKEGQAK